MNTKIVRMDEEQIEEEVIQRAGQIIRSGGLVAFPTDRKSVV